MEQSLIQKAYLVSGMPHILLSPEANPGYQRLRQAYEEIRREIEAQDADLILYFSTGWLSILGYMFQADPLAEWVHVDQNFHQLGSIPYRLRFDPAFAQGYADQVASMGYKTRLISYKGFPIDTGTIVASRLLNPEQKLPQAIVSCNMYSEKDETLRLGQAAGRALAKAGKKAIVVLVSNLSHRFHTSYVPPQEDRISAKKDEEWNRKILELLEQGQVEDVSQCVRDFARQANGDQKFKGLWWLNGLLGGSNDFQGKVHAYEAVAGVGAALVSLSPTRAILAETFQKELSSEEGSQAELVEELCDFEAQFQRRSIGKSASETIQPTTQTVAKQAELPCYEINSAESAEPVGAYPHARRYGDLLFLSGIGPRKPGQKAIPGVELNEQGQIVHYDVKKQTESVLENIRAILKAAGSSLDKVIDVQVFLTNMKADFAAYNEVYQQAFGSIRPTRTTVQVVALPTPIAVEFKVIARP